MTQTQTQTQTQTVALAAPKAYAALQALASAGPSYDAPRREAAAALDALREAYRSELRDAVSNFEGVRQDLEAARSLDRVRDLAHDAMVAARQAVSYLEDALDLEDAEVMLERLQDAASELESAETYAAEAEGAVEDAQENDDEGFTLAAERLAIALYLRETFEPGHEDDEEREAVALALAASEEARVALYNATKGLTGDTPETASRLAWRFGLYA